jgi:murein DD-endopeptidase MepM/ murein hydrolase activator NlpD
VRIAPLRTAPLRTARLSIVLPVGLALLAGGLALATRQAEMAPDSPFPLTATEPYHRAAPSAEPPTADFATAERPPVPLDLTFRRGETLGAALAGVGLDAAEVHTVAEAVAPWLDVRRIRPGDRYAVFQEDGAVVALQFVVAGRGRVRLERAAEAWQAAWQPFERRTEGRVLRGVVDGSLVGAVVAAGGPTQLAWEIAEVLQWDVDFSRDLRRGDRFEVAYGQEMVDGRPEGVGPVWALSLDNGGRHLEAYRYGEDGGYYDAEGRPLKKMFLRSPVKLAHVTSRFSHRRLHPVLKVYRPHYGVDYRAAVGTPVHATANGVVTFSGWDRGGGKVVKVRHPNGYLTAYLHLSRFAAGVKPGRRVLQGEVIAYSGNTGLSTAPHLDYRVQAGGRWIDPLTLRNVPAEPIPQAQVATFEAWRDACRTGLELGRPAMPVAPPAGEVRVAEGGGAGAPPGRPAADASAGR